MSGLTLSTTGGLNITVSSGKAMGECAVDLPGNSINAPASSSGYVWIDPDNNNLSTSTTLTDLGAPYVRLGSFTSTGSTVTVGTSGRMALDTWLDPMTESLAGGLVILDLLNQRVGIGRTPSHPFHSAFDLFLDGQANVGTFAALVNQGSSPVHVTGEILIYGRTVGGIVELFAMDSAGNETQITSGGTLHVPQQVVVKASGTVNGTNKVFTAPTAPVGGVLAQMNNGKGVLIPIDDYAITTPGGVWTMTLTGDAPQPVGTERDVADCILLTYMH
jgi:hypothetical protein